MARWAIRDSLNNLAAANPTKVFAMRIPALLAVLLLSPIGAAFGQTLTPDQQELRAIYQELVETNTTNSVGSCTVAAQAVERRLKAAGYKDGEITLVVPPGAPKKGNLVARLAGTGAKRPLMLLAHLDVVEAKRDDWTRDPFKLVEENGFFYARGAYDDKAMAAVFVANMIRYKREKFMPARDLILALTCDEEIVPSEFDGVDYLLKHHRPLIDAELALTEGASGILTPDGKPLFVGVAVGEKTFQSFDLEVTNQGGHSSLPQKDNAIYHLADGLSRLGQFNFPIHVIDVTRAYFGHMAKLESGPLAADMAAAAKQPPDPAALERLANSQPGHNATLRTTCVATMLDAGHATNALPQRAHAVVNCRILPGESIDSVRQTLVKVIADDKVSIKPLGQGAESPAPPLNPQLFKAASEVAAVMWPGVPLVPVLQVASTDGRLLNTAGIWTYGINGMFANPDKGNAHGLNEYLRVQSLYESHTFLDQLTRKLAAP